MKKKIGMAAILAGIIIAMGTLSGPARAGSELGVYRWGADDSNPHTGPEGVNLFSQWVKSPVALGNDFTDFTQGWNNMQAPSWQYQPWQKWLKAKPGRNVMIGYPVLPGINRVLPDGTSVSWAQCAAGDYDQYYANFAQGLMNYGADSIYIRLAWEFDGNWYGWGVNNGEEADFVACWKDVVNTMRAAAPGNNFKFVWNVDTYYQTNRGGISWLQTTYPGDAYVDDVAIELYDNTWDSQAYPFPTSCDASCKQQRRTDAWNNDLMPATENLLAFAQLHKKPFGFGEWGVDNAQDWVNGGYVQHGGLDDAGYIERMFHFINDPANDVAFASYFDVWTGDGDHEISPADGPTQFPISAAKFRKLFTNNTGAPATGGSSGISTIPVPENSVASFNIAVPTEVSGFSFDSNQNDWGYMLPGAYLQFSVYAAVAGTYSFVLTESTTLKGAAANVSVNGQRAATLPVPSTGNWNTGQSLPAVSVQLPAGRSALRVTDKAGQSFNVFGMSLALAPP